MSMGPAEFVLGEGLDVRPHPHINLATVAYHFRRRDHAPGQSRNRARHPTGRSQLDDGRPRHL